MQERCERERRAASLQRAGQLHGHIWRKGDTLAAAEQLLQQRLCMSRCLLGARVQNL